MGFRNDVRLSRGGRLLRMLLEEKGKAAKDLAERLEVTPAAVSKWMGGDSIPPDETVAKMCAILELSANEAERLRETFRETPRMPLRSSSDRPGFSRRHDLMRVGDAFIHSVFRRLRHTCRWDLEEPAESPVRCDALIRSRRSAEESVGLVFLLQPEFDPGECSRMTRALRIFYEREGLKAVLFFRPFLSNDLFDRHQHELRVEEKSPDEDWEIVYDWSLVPAVAARIESTPEAERFMAASQREVRSGFMRPIYLSENHEHKGNALTIKERCDAHHNLAWIDFPNGEISFKGRNTQGVIRYLIGEIEAWGENVMSDLNWSPSPNGATAHRGGSGYVGYLETGRPEHAVRYLKKFFRVIACPENPTATQAWIDLL